MAFRPDLALQAPLVLGGRELYSKEQWEAQKDVIKQIYNQENKPFKRVIDILRTEHNFYPTRRQFYRKISEWGFEKNIKDKEMRALVQNLSQTEWDGKDHALELRGQKIDLVKIQRWQRRHGRLKDGARPPTSSFSMACPSTRILRMACGNEFPMEASDGPTLDSTKDGTKHSQMAKESSSRKLSNWNLVDVPGSPSLSRLFDALRIESESAIPTFDLGAALSSISEVELDRDADANAKSDEWCGTSVDSVSKDIVRYSCEVFQESEALATHSFSDLAVPSFSEWNFREWDFSSGQPMKANLSQIFGLSPFPVSSGRTQDSTSWHTRIPPHAHSHNFQLEETRRKNILYQFKRIFGANNPKTLGAMGNLGNIYAKRGNYKQAERLYRRVAISYQKTLGLKHFHTLSAYLDVIALLWRQVKVMCASNIHQRIYSVINENFDQDDTLVLRANSLQAKMLFVSGQFDEAEELIRKTLQIDLHTFGPRHSKTLHDMKVLAENLRHRGRFVESEQLFRLNLSLYSTVNSSFSARFFDSMEGLGVLLQKQKRYDECKNLALTTVGLMGKQEENQHQDALFSLYRVAACTRKMGDLLESERQLRSILEHCSEENVCVYVYLMELSSVLEDIGHYDEAAPLLQKCYKWYLERVGASHPSTIYLCKGLAKCYKKLKRYEDAIPFLQKAVDFTRSQGEQHTRGSLKDILGLARLLRKTGQYTDAIPLYEECLHEFLAIHESLPTDRFIVQAVAGLGICYEGLGRYEESLALLRLISDEIRRIEGDQHPMFKSISERVVEIIVKLASGNEKLDESPRDSHYGVPAIDEMAIDKGPTSMDDVIAEGSEYHAEEDWMRELFDFDLMEDPSST